MTLLGRILATVRCREHYCQRFQRFQRWQLIIFTLCSLGSCMCRGSSSTVCLSQLSACSQGGVLAGAVLGLIYVFQEKLVCA